MLERCPAGSTASSVTDLSVGRAILEEAARTNAGAIAMASHGRGGVLRAIMGSVADETVRRADVPVLIYRPESSAP
jgi:nucleotide-binding universal stress UspA family protein